MASYKYRATSRRILGDLHTPVSIYLKVRDLYPQSALLESSDFHASENATSYIGIDPIASFAVNSGECTVKYPDASTKRSPVTDTESIEKALLEFLSSFTVDGADSGVCGLFGYTSFNAVRYLENIPVAESRQKLNDAPDMYYIMYRHTLVFDHFKNELTLVELLADGETPRTDDIVSVIENRNFASYDFFTTGKEYSTITDEQYMDFVRRGVRHCMRGDVFQIVLSRRFVVPYRGDDFKVYRALRSINPSPYLFYFDFGGFRIFGSSPETHCKIEDGIASIDPIAGTTRRSGNAAEDKRLAQQLLADPKENAEHVMLVDLARNDLSRGCDDVKVDFYKEPQYYSHVIHLVSRVSGRVKAGHSSVRTFLDTFPAGTLSGAPKVRAMQLISEIEPHSRGAYGGCIGFIGLNGNINQAITIRSLVSRGGVLWCQAGAGIVAASRPENELQEVNNKLGALKKAIEAAEKLKN